MYKIFKFLAGYLEIYITGVSSERFLNLCGNKNILLWNIQKVEDGYVMCVSKKGFFQMKEIVYKTSCKVVIQKRIGLPFFVEKMTKKWFFIVMIILIFVFGLLSQKFIWNVKIEGTNYFVEASEIKDFLQQQGIYAGALRKNICLPDVERMIRAKYDEITWISAYMHQNTLQIAFRENDKPLSHKNHIFDYTTKEQNTTNKRNQICATKTGVITSMITRTGTPLVKIGQTVKQGDVLVEGKMMILDQNEMPSHEEAVTADADIMIRCRLKKKIQVPLFQKKEWMTGKRKCYPFITINDHLMCFRILDIPFSSYQIKNHKSIPDITLFHDTIGFGFQYIYETKTESVGKTDSEIETEFQKLLIDYKRRLQEKGIQILSKNVNIEKNMDYAVLNTTLLVNGPFCQSVSLTSENNMEYLELDSE